jgi:hypothetical protein
VTRGQATSIKSSVRCSPEGPQTTTTQSDKLPSYLQSFTHIRPARPSKGSSELGSDVSGQNPKHLEASRSIFSSQCMQNRHQAISRCKLLFLQKTNLSLTRQRRSAGGAKRLATRLALASFARLPSVSTPIDLVELSGIEPLTPCLQSRCSPR